MNSLLIVMAILFFGCVQKGKQTDETYQSKDSMVNRKAMYSGQFYPGSSDGLQSTLKDYFLKAEPVAEENVMAIISPHAGYIFSGQVAASAYNQLDSKKKYDNIFILASSHRMAFKGASIYTAGNYETPLGEVPVNIDLGKKLIHDYPDIFTSNPEAHLNEHSLEVQLPMLQFKLGKALRIVPIIIGTQDKELCKKMASALKPYFGGNNLFVISSDFSHYPEYNLARKVDKITAEAICSNNPEKMYITIHKTESDNYPSVATCLCGWTSVITLMYMTENIPDVKYHQIAYMNSGDVKEGGKDRCVGYCAISVTTPAGASQASFSLSREEKVMLLDIARKALKSYLIENTFPKIEETELPAKLLEPCGVFVTLNKNGHLRGCIGIFSTSQPLYRVVQEMSVSSALRDSRFPAVSISELSEIDIEISVLSPMKRINNINEIELGRHGIYIKKGLNSGTFLPQVATETGWSLEEFLGHCARDKAGIGWEGWKNAEIFTYEALVFSESELLKK